MRHARYFLLLFLGLLVAPVFAQTTKSVSATALAVGFTNLGDILEKMPETVNASNQIALLQTQSDNELKRLQKEFQEKYSTYEKGAAQLSDVIRKDKEMELENLQKRIQEFTRNAEATIQRKYNELMNPITKKAFEVIGEVAKENGYTYILNTDPGTNPFPNLLFTSSQFDVTELVLAKMGLTAKPDSVVIKPTVPNKAVPKR